MLLENNIQKYAFSAKLLWNSMRCEKRYTSKFELNIWMPLFAVSRCSRFTVKLSERCRLTAWTRAVRWVSTPEAERISRLCAQTSLRWEEDKLMLQNPNISAYIMRLKSCNIRLSLRLCFWWTGSDIIRGEVPHLHVCGGSQWGGDELYVRLSHSYKVQRQTGPYQKKELFGGVCALVTCLVLQYFLLFQSCDQDCHTHWHVKERWTILCVQNVGSSAFALWVFFTGCYFLVFL